MWLIKYTLKESYMLQTSPLSTTFLHMVVTVQGTIATKQLQAGLLQMHLRLI